MSDKSLLSSVSQYGLFSLRYFPFSNTSRVGKERRRNEFGLAIRHLFLRFLIKVESQAMRRLFTESELNDIAHGSIDNFNIHHIRGINIGGRNFNTDLLPEINKIYLSKDEVSGLSHRDWEPVVLGRRMEHYLRNQERRGHLKTAFQNLFAGYLVFLPRELHQKIEDEIITPAIEDAQENYKPQILLPYTTQLLIDPKSKAYKKLIKEGLVSAVERPEQPTVVSYNKTTFRSAPMETPMVASKKRLTKKTVTKTPTKKRKPNTVAKHSIKPAVKKKAQEGRSGRQHG